MSTKRTVCFSSLAVLLVAFLYVSLPLQAADTAGDSEEVTKLLSEAKTQAVQLKDDASEMQSFTLSNLSWGSYATKIMAIKADVNKVGETVSKLNKARSTASSWQKTAIDRVNPVLRELAANVEATIDHFNKDRGRPLQTSEHKEYLSTNAELATRMSALVSDFVDYGETKEKFEKLSQKLEISER